MSVAGLELAAAAQAIPGPAPLSLESTMRQDDIAIPVLPSRSVNDPLAFDRRLGFDGKIWGAPHFDATLRRGAIELRFFTHAERRPTESSASCSARVVARALISWRIGHARARVVAAQPRRYTIVLPDTAEGVSRYLNRAGRLYGDGLRVFYMAFPVVAWLFDATMMLAATAGVLWIRWQLDTADMPKD